MTLKEDLKHIKGPFAPHVFRHYLEAIPFSGLSNWEDAIVDLVEWAGRHGFVPEDVSFGEERRFGEPEMIVWIKFKTRYVGEWSEWWIDKGEEWWKTPEAELRMRA